MIDLKNPLAVLATRLPRGAIQAALVPKLARQALPTKRVQGQDLLGLFEVEFGGTVTPAGRPRLPVRLMASPLHLKNNFNLSDEELVERWAENVQWQFSGGTDYYEPRLSCDATQIGRFRRLLGEEGIEQSAQGMRVASTASGWRMSIIESSRARNKSSVAIRFGLQNFQQPMSIEIIPASSRHSHPPCRASIHEGRRPFAGPTR